jgi:MarR family transcriptional regulator, 2-MHQ and catechol-resistance regulon repressor
MGVMVKFRGSKQHTLALNTFVKLVRCTSSVCNDVHNHFLSELTVSQFAILEALYHLGPMSQKELAAKILKSPGNITTIINNLEKSELVIRKVNNEDKRYYTIQLTDKGRLIIERIFPIHADAILKRFSILTESEQQTLGKLLRKLSLGPG